MRKSLSDFKSRKKKGAWRLMCDRRSRLPPSHASAALHRQKVCSGSGRAGIFLLPEKQGIFSAMGIGCHQVCFPLHLYKFGNIRMLLFGFSYL